MAEEGEEKEVPKPQGTIEVGRSGKTLSDEELYLRLRQAIADMPNLNVDRVPVDLAKWLGEVTFLVEESGDFVDATTLKLEAAKLGSMISTGPDQIPVILYRALARAEAKAPSSAHGTFIAAGKPLDALAAVTKLLSEAKADVLIVDAYAEANLLTDFLVAASEGIALRVLADAKTLKPTLVPAAERWIKQFGAARPLEVRAAPKGELHDRLIFLDRSVVWVLGQSFNQLATRSHTSLMKADPELGKMKIAAYEKSWGAASPIV